MSNAMISSRWAICAAFAVVFARVPVCRADDAAKVMLPPQTEQAECVILLHGLARTRLSMRPLEIVLERQGFEVVNQGYPSRSDEIVPLAEQAMSEARRSCGADQTPSAVTHSMGGILLRAYAQAHPSEAWGRVVMLGPPNHGSEIIDAYGGSALFEWLNGPASLQLKTDGFPDQLPPVPFETGIIAGTQSLNPLTSKDVEGADDGKVSVESTKVEGMTAHLTLPVTHTFMMQSPVVIAQVISFLRTGEFEKDLTTGEALKRIGSDE